ncbi:MAG: hypothetical protein LUE29_14060 [Lachnospiraceae bacterium]|nr:hypothetical protein [Lachnospiraceae bacterium]
MATAVILSPEEYTRLSEIEENHILLAEACERLEKNENSHRIPMADVMARHGITQEELDQMEDIAIG